MKEKEIFYDELLEYIKTLRKKQRPIASVDLRMTIFMLEEIKPHFLKEKLNNTGGKKWKKNLKKQ